MDLFKKYKNHELEVGDKKIKFHYMTCDGYQQEGHYYQFWFYWFRKKLVYTRWFIDGVEQYEFKK